MKGRVAAALVLLLMLAATPTAIAGPWSRDYCHKVTVMLDDGTEEVRKICLPPPLYVGVIPRDDMFTVDPPDWCSLDGKDEYRLWWVAVLNEDRALMYHLCAEGVMP